jgi:hypothetical protein
LDSINPNLDNSVSKLGLVTQLQQASYEQGSIDPDRVGRDAYRQYSGDAFVKRLQHCHERFQCLLEVGQHRREVI